MAPDDFNEVYFVAVQTSLSLDGGKTYERFSIKGGDSHDIWIDPVNPDRIVIANDQYVATSLNRGKTWNGVRLPTAQMYHVAVDNQIPTSSTETNKMALPTEARATIWGDEGGIPSTVWHSVGGGESGFTVPDPVNNNIIWSANYQGTMTPLQPGDGSQPGGCRMARRQYRRAPQRFEVSVSMDVPHNHIAPRPQQGLCRQPIRSPNHERRTELGGYQPGSFNRRSRHVGKKHGPPYQ